MPKKVFTVKDFSGGLNTQDDLNSMADNELEKLDNMTVIRGSKISMNTLFTSQVDLAGQVDTLNPGYGLYTFGTDYSSGTVNAVYVIAGENSANNRMYLEVWSYTGSREKLYSGFNDATGVDSLQIAPTGSTYTPVMTFVSGGLRLVDGNFNNTSSTSKWVGYVDRIQFNNISSTPSTATSIEIDKWCYTDHYQAAPTRGLSGDFVSITPTGGGSSQILASAGTYPSAIQNEIDSQEYIAIDEINGEALKVLSYDSDAQLTTEDHVSGTWSAANPTILASLDGKGFCLFAEAAGSNGNLTTGTYEFGQSFIYDSNVETSIVSMAGTLDIAANERINANITFMGAYPARVTGGRIYFRLDTEDEWKLFSEIDLIKGVRVTPDDNYKTFGFKGVTGEQSLAGKDSRYYVSSQLQVTENSELTFKILNGYDFSELKTFKYKTATIANRRMYIGNVYNIDSGEIQRDAVYKSIPNKFDVFLDQGILEVVRDDGEEVVKLENFNDKLFEFKEQTLYIINIGSDVEYLEYTNPFLGVTKPYHTCKTEKGIAIINENGVYLHNGEDYINLLLKTDQKKRLISYENWKSFFSDNSSIGYDPVRKSIIITDNVDSISDSYEFDIERYFWSTITSVGGSGDVSNMVTNFKGEVAYYQETGQKIFSKTTGLSSTSRIFAHTKIFDFGNPDTLKHLYKVIIRSKGSDGDVSVKFRNDADSTNTARDFTTTYLTSAAILTEQEFKVDSSEAGARNQQAFGLRFAAGTSSVDSDFEIDEIRFIYREKEDR